jgi:hypothetical protein
LPVWREILIEEWMGNADVCWWQSSGWFWKFLGLPGEAPCVAVPLKHGPLTALGDWPSVKFGKLQNQPEHSLCSALNLLWTHMQGLQIQVQNPASPLPFQCPRCPNKSPRPPPAAGIACPHEVASPHRTLESRAPAGHLRLHILPSLSLATKLQGAVSTKYGQGCFKNPSLSAASWGLRLAVCGH